MSKNAHEKINVRQTSRTQFKSFIAHCQNAGFRPTARLMVMKARICNKSEHHAFCEQSELLINKGHNFFSGV